MKESSPNCLANIFEPPHMDAGLCCHSKGEDMQTLWCETLRRSETLERLKCLACQSLRAAKHDCWLLL